MRRVVFFSGILLFLFAATFGLSVWLSPAWLQQSGGASTLSVVIIMGGLVVAGEAILSWVLSFLFADKEFTERLEYALGNKYKEISKNIDTFTKQEIEKEKRSRKYIPNVFVEVIEIKEKLRYFSEPHTFFAKIIEQSDRELQNSFIISRLEQIHFPFEDPIRPRLNKKPKKTSSLIQQIEKYKKFLEQKKAITNVLIKKGGVGIKPEFRSQIPAKYSHIHDYARYHLQYHSLFEHNIEEIQDDLDLLTNKLVIIKGVAGHGKTNLLCDFTENFLIKKKHKSLYIPAREFNYLGEQETIEQAIVRITLAEYDYQFSDVLRLIKFDKKIDNLFILIDGINEHKNLALFSTAIEQFIQRCSLHNIKIILTCRSEYFDDRFGSLLNMDQSSIFDLDGWRYANRIPDVHVDALISGYFSEFNINLSVDNIHPDIMKAFNKDKLLLRIFCEAYENEKPAEYLDNLYKLEIFKKYYDKKTETIHGLDDCLTEIIGSMIRDNLFANIPISDLSAETIVVVENTVYDNVVIKKDFLANPDVAFGRSEVINFVYDEFRDFLIASRVIMEWDQNRELSIAMMQNLSAPRIQVAEGLQRYLCLWAIKNKNNELLDHLFSHEWFARTFIESVFDTPDSLLTSFVIDLVKRLFGSNAQNALRILWRLTTRRANTKGYTNLNIETMFVWLNEFDDEKYKEIIVSALQQDYDYDVSYITYFCYEITQLLKEKKISETPLKNFILLLSYLVGVTDSKHRRYRRYYLGEYPAFETLVEISDFIDHQLLQEQIARVLEEIEFEFIKDNLQTLLELLGDE